MAHYVYMLASRPYGALYTGRSFDLRQRVDLHRKGHGIHTATYGIRTLVWFELCPDFDTSLRRERAIKRWHRRWKEDLIEAANPHWQDITHLIP